MHIRHVTWALALLPTLSLAAEEPAATKTEVVPLVKVDGFDLTNLHYSIFAAQRSDGQPNPDDQIRLLNELVNTFMVARSAYGKAMARHPEIQAAMEVSNARLLARAVINEQIEKIQIPQEDIEAVYEERYLKGGREEFKARHILLESEEEARAVIAELEAGADFAQLAKERSTGPSARQGGDLGWFTPGSMVKPFADAVISLENGSYTHTPVQTRFGWHVVLREDSRERPIPELDESLKTKISNELKSDRLSAFIKELRKKAKVTVLGDLGQEEAPASQQ